MIHAAGGPPPGGARGKLKWGVYEFKEPAGSYKKKKIGWLQPAPGPAPPGPPRLHLQWRCKEIYIAGMK